VLLMVLAAEMLRMRGIPPDAAGAPRPIRFPFGDCGEGSLDLAAIRLGEPISDSFVWYVDAGDITKVGFCATSGVSFTLALISLIEESLEVWRARAKREGV
jgi:hypothetical protein